MLRVLGDDRDGLDARGAGADDADPLAGEIHFLVRPRAGVIRPAGEVVDSWKRRHVGRRQAPDGGDADIGL